MIDKFTVIITTSYLFYVQYIYCVLQKAHSIVSGERHLLFVFHNDFTISREYLHLIIWTTISILLPTYGG